MIRSLRMRLFLGTTLVSAIFLSILCFTILTALERTLHADFNRGLIEKARLLASLVEQEGTEVHFDYRRSLFPEFEPGDRSDYFEILLDGKRFARSLSLEGPLDMGTTRPPTRPTPVTLPNGREGKRVTLAFKPRVEGRDARGPEHSAVIGLAVRTEYLTARIRELRVWVVSLSAAATLLSGIALVLVVGHAVRPVKTLAAQIESVRISADALSPPPLVSAPVPSELSPVVDRLNDLLQRLGQAFTRERAFAADVAHELRTPVAGLMTTLEVCRTRPRGSAEYEAAIDKSLGMLQRMQTMIERLLLLSRAEAGQIAVNLSSVDVHSLLLDCWQDHEAAARARGLTLELRGKEIPPVRADAELLRIIFNNLFDNAISYADAGSILRVEIVPFPDHVGISFTNTGHALKAEDVPRLQDRFWRKDAARSATGLHAGLGLSLVQRLAGLQGMKLGLRLEGERFVVEIKVLSAEC
jgi:two-component system, OmpR family, heavy metal sensor histidine kinase CusS